MADDDPEPTRFETLVANLKTYVPDPDSDTGYRTRLPRRPTKRGVVGRLARPLLRIIGDPTRAPVRLLGILVVLSAVAAFAGVFLYVQGTLEATTATGSMARTAIELATNYYVWAGIAALAGLIAVKGWWHFAAKRTAAHSRYSVATVKRLSAEVKSTDGTTRIIGTTEHSFDQLRAKLLRAFNGDATDDVPGDVAVEEPEPEWTGKAIEGEVVDVASDEGVATDTDADPDTNTEPDTEPEADTALTPAEKYDRLDDELASIRIEMDDLEATLLTSELSNERIAQFLHYDEDAAALADLLDDEGRTALEELEAAEERAEEIVERMNLLADVETGRIDGELLGLHLHEAGYTPRGWETSEEAGDRDVEDVVDDTADTPDDADDTDVVDEAVEELRETWQAMRMDVAASLNYSEVLWRFVLPAAATVFAVFTAARTPFFNPLFYLVIAAGAATVGGAVFFGTKWRRRRKLGGLREERERSQWSSNVALAKRVQTPEQTMYVAWMGGRVYGDYDKHRLARSVARRWRQYIDGDRVAPAIQQKFARQIRRMIPLLHQFEYSDSYEGRYAVHEDLIREVRDAKDPDGFVAKRELCERVADRGEGVGHDPDIIAEVYRDMVPDTLAETDVEITDSDGRMRTMTAVHLRTNTVPDDLAQIQTQFSQQFQADADYEWDLPTVEHRHRFATNAV